MDLTGVSYKDGWQFSIENGQLAITLSATDSHRNDTDTSVVGVWEIPVDADHRWLRDRILDVERHEVDENFRFNGDLIFNPHDSKRAIDGVSYNIGGPTNLSSIQDDFLAPTLNAQWDIGYGTVSTTSGYCDISTAGDIHTVDAALDGTNSSFAVQLKRAGADAVTNLVINSSATPGTGLRMAIDATTNRIAYQVWVAFDDDGSSLDDAYDPVAMQWLQVIDTGADTLFQASPDGTAWVTLRTITTPAWFNSTQVYLSVDGTPSTSTQFDNVNLPPAPPGTALAKVSTFSDDFEATFDETKWDHYGTVVTSAGVLDISTNGAAQSISTARLDATAAQCAVQVPQLSDTVTNFVLNSITGGTNVRFSTDTVNLTFSSQVGYDDPSPTTVTYNATDHAWWRFRETTSTLYWETSPDGITWTDQLSTFTPSWLNSVQISLAVDGTPTISAQFDNLNVLSSTPPVLPLAETLIDSFDGEGIDSSLWLITGDIFQSTDLQATATAAGSYITSKNLYDLRESNYTGYVTPTTTEDTFFQVLSATAGTSLQFIVSGTTLYANNLINGVDPTPGTTPWPYADPFWARIRSTTGTVYFEYSATGKAGTFTTLKSFPSPSWVSSTAFRFGNAIPAASGGSGGTGGGGSGGSTSVESTGNAPPSGTDITVDFRASALIAVATLDKWSIGNHFSTFHDGGVNAIYGGADAATWKANLKALGPMVWRVPIRWNNGSPGSAAGQAQTGAPDADNYIKAAFEIGGYPYLSIGGNTVDNNMTNSDCSNLIHHFNDNPTAFGGKLERICMGNEPTNDGDAGIAAYLLALPGWCSAVKAADSSVLISAPADGNGDPSDSLMTGCLTSGANFDIYSLHAYDLDQGPSAPATYATKITTMRSQWHAAFPSKPIIVGFEEFNQHSDYDHSAHHSAGDDWWADYHNTVAIAETIGHILKAGGHAYSFCDAGSSMGLLADGTGANGTGAKFTQLPAYHGIGMVTGYNGLMKRMTPPGGGTQMVAASSTSADLRVFANNSGKLLVVNYSSTDHTSVIGIGDRSNGTYSVWQTNKSLPNSMPTQKVNNATYANARLTVTFPAGTVTSVDLS